MQYSDIGLAVWAGRAAAGNAIEYRCGHLVEDRNLIKSRLSEETRAHVDRIADTAPVIEANGQLLLAQRRLGERCDLCDSGEAVIDAAIDAALEHSRAPTNADIRWAVSPRATAEAVTAGHHRTPQTVNGLFHALISDLSNPGRRSHDETALAHARRGALRRSKR